MAIRLLSLSMASPAAFAISNFAITESDNAGAMTLTTNRDGTAHIWIGPTGTTPDAAAIIAGTGADSKLTQAVNVFGGPYSLTLPTTLSGDYRVSVVVVDGGAEQSNVLTQSPVAFDTVPVGLTADFVYQGESGGFPGTGTPTYTDLPPLLPGRYLVFCFAETGGDYITGGTLEGTALSMLGTQVVNGNNAASCFEVNIAGAGNRTLVLTSSDTDSQYVVPVIVFIGSGTVAETEQAITLATPPDFDHTFANSADGIIVAAGAHYSNTAPDSYNNLPTQLLAATAKTRFNIWARSATVSGGSPTSVGVNYPVVYGGASGFAVKVV